LTKEDELNREYPTIKKTLMRRICERKNADGVADVKEVIDSYGGYQDKELVEKAILKYEEENDFYDISNGKIVLTTTGIDECERKNPGMDD
jgi:hypothetical protein